MSTTVSITYGKWLDLCDKMWDEYARNRKTKSQPFYEYYKNNYGVRIESLSYDKTLLIFDDTPMQTIFILQYSTFL